MKASLSSILSLLGSGLLAYACSGEAGNGIFSDGGAPTDAGAGGGAATGDSGGGTSAGSLGRGGEGAEPGASGGAAGAQGAAGSAGLGVAGTDSEPEGGTAGGIAGGGAAGLGGDSGGVAGNSGAAGKSGGAAGNSGGAGGEDAGGSAGAGGDLTGGPVGNPTPAVHPTMLVDFVGTSDAAVNPDSASDGAFVVDVTGPIDGMILVTVDSDGNACCGQQWDTLVVPDPLPDIGSGFIGTASPTWVLGVLEGGVLRNDSAGRLSLAAGPHRLTLLGANSGYFTTGQLFRFFYRRPGQTTWNASGVFAW